MYLCIYLFWTTFVVTEAVGACGGRRDRRRREKNLAEERRPQPGWEEHDGRSETHNKLIEEHRNKEKPQFSYSEADTCNLASAGCALRAVSRRWGTIEPARSQTAALFTALCCWQLMSSLNGFTRRLPPSAHSVKYIWVRFIRIGWRSNVTRIKNEDKKLDEH